MKLDLSSITRPNSKNLVNMNFTGYPDNMQTNMYGGYGVDGTSDFKPNAMFDDLQNQIGERSDRVLQTINIRYSPAQIDQKPPKEIIGSAQEKLKVAALAKSPKFKDMGKVLGWTVGVLAVAGLLSVVSK